MTQYVKRRRATGAQARMQQIPRVNPKEKVQEETADEDEFTDRELLGCALGCIGLLLLIIGILGAIIIWS